MNVFFTDHDPVRCANDHCKIHTRKMIIEYAQMLSTAHRILDGDRYADNNSLYKITHKNHPSTKWVREYYQNYEWLYLVLEQLCKNYQDATGKIHKTSRLLEALQYAPMNIQPRGVMTVPPMAMPEALRTENVVMSYRNYVLTKYKDWQSRQRPLKVEWYFSNPEWIYDN